MDATATMTLPQGMETEACTHVPFEDVKVVEEVWVLEKQAVGWMSAEVDGATSHIVMLVETDQTSGALPCAAKRLRELLEMACYSDCHEEEVEKRASRAENEHCDGSFKDPIVRKPRVTNTSS